MKNVYIAFGLLLTAISLQGCIATQSNGETVMSAQSRASGATANDAVKKEAIEVASKEVVVAGDPHHQAVTVCPLSSGRLEVREDGTESVYGKNGELLATRRIPLGNVGGQVDSKIDRTTAINLTKEDAIAVYASIERFKISACDLHSVWRVVYELNDDISGGGPDYVVDKRSGRIIYKRYSQ